MIDDIFFRHAFFAFFTLLAAVRFYYKLKANVFRDRIFSRDEGAGLMAARAVLGMPLVLAILAYLFLPGRFPWMRIPLPGWLRWCGLVTAGLSLVLLVWVHRALGKNFSTSIRVKRHHELVMIGPYSWIRHPMYSAYFLIFLSAFLISENWIIGTAGMAVILLLMTWRLRLEESLLVGRFGESYLGYRLATPKFLPFSLPKKGAPSAWDRTDGRSESGEKTLDCP